MQIKIEKFICNEFQQNTYLLYKTCKENVKKGILIDAGQSQLSEYQALMDFLKKEEIVLEKLLLTHAHLDHVLGLPFVFQKYDLIPMLHEKDYQMLQYIPQFAQTFGKKFAVPSYPNMPFFLTDNEEILWNDLKIEVRFVPGHAPGHLAFVLHQEQIVFAGDVLFYHSVGRTDLPMSSEIELKNSILQKLYTLPDDFVVYPGHGRSTTIGEEKKYNPYVRF